MFDVMTSRELFKLVTTPGSSASVLNYIKQSVSALNELSISIFAKLADPSIRMALMMNKEASPLVQFFIQSCSPSQITFLLSTIDSSLFFLLSCHPVGSSHLRNILLLCKGEEQMQLMSDRIEDKLDSMIFDRHAYEVVCSFLKNFPYRLSRLVDRAFHEPRMMLAVCQSQWGVFVLALVCGLRSPDKLAMVYLSIARVASTLVYEPVGHTAVMKCYRVGSATISKALMKSLQGQFLHMSLHPYAAKVVLQAIECNHQDTVNLIIEELCEVQPKALSAIPVHPTQGAKVYWIKAAKHLLASPIGTPVLQAALYIASEEQIIHIMSTMRLYLPRQKPKFRRFWNRCFRSAWTKVKGRSSPTGTPGSLASDRSPVSQGEMSSPPDHNTR